MAGFISSIDDTFTWLFTGKKPPKKEKKLPFEPVYFHKLCIALRDSVPTEAKLLLKANLAFDNSLIDCQVEAKTKHGNKTMDISEKSKEEIRKALFELRTHTVNIGGAYWHGVTLHLDVPKDNYNIDFSYPTK